MSSAVLFRCRASGLFWSRLAVCGLLLLTLFIGGCSAKRVSSTDEIESLEWSGPYDSLLIRWVGEIGDYRDTGLKLGVFKRLGTFLFGERTERIVKPYGIHAIGSQQLLVSDPGLSAVHLMDIAGGDYRVITGGDADLLTLPVGVTSDGQENAYITDSAAGRIYAYDLKKKFLKQFNVDPVARPTGIAFSANNWLIYVSDTTAHQIIAFGVDGQERFRFSGRGSGPGELNYPTDLWVDNSGRVIVTDSLNARLVIFSAGGEFLEEVGTRGHAAGYMDKPKGVAVDSDGHYYVCDALKDAVQVYDRDGHYLFKFGDQGQGQGQFWMPAGIFIDENDKIYVADAYNHRVQVFQYLNTATGDR